MEKICKRCGKKYEKETNLHIGYCSVTCKNIDRTKFNEIIEQDNYAEIIVKSKTRGINKALIDKEDIQKVKNLTWWIDKKGYIYSTKEQKTIKLHRFIMNCPENKQIDHINHNKLDNRKCNLRICTNFQNAQNKTNNNSGKIGVFFRKDRNKFIAYINQNNKRINLGTFNTYDEAVKVRENEERRILCQI